MTAAEFLRSAARRLRRNAAAATPGPWRSDYSEGGCVASANPRHPIIAEYGATWDDSEYIATVHPGVGLAVAEWLEVAAELSVVYQSGSTRWRHEMVVAAQINGFVWQPEQVPA